MKLKSLILLCVLAFANFIVAQESEGSLNVDLQMTPKYVWRGMTFTDGLVYQPSIAITQKQLTIQLWGNFVLHDKNDIPGNELDVYVTYNYDYSGFTFTPSLFLYTYPGQDVNTTTEFSLGISHEIDDFTLSTSLSKDLVEARGAFFGSLDLKYSKNIAEGLSLDLTTGAGYGNEPFNEYYVGVAKNALNYYMIGGTLKYSLNQNISVRTYFENFWILDNEIKETLGSDTFNFGVAVGVEL